MLYRPLAASLLFSLVVVLLPTDLSAQASADEGQRIVEEDLDDAGLSALPVSLPEIDEEEIRTRFAEAEALFHSVDQDTSLPIFGNIVDQLEPRETAGQLSEPLRELLARSLAYRAQLHFNFDATDLAGQSLARMLEIKPDFDLDRSQASPKLVDQFDALRRRMIGEIHFVLEPADAEVLIDGRAVDAVAGPVSILVGQRLLEVTLPGFAGITRDLEIEAGVSVTMELALERTSAVIRLHTRPPEATVLIAGEVRGTTAGSAPEGFLPPGSTAAYRQEEFSSELVLDGIDLGLVVVEIRKDGFRSQRFELPISEWLDYPLPPIVLEKERGSLLFDNFPAGAEIRIDGQARQPDNPGVRKPQLTLPPGSYHVTVSEGSSRMFSTQLQLADRQRMEIDVRLRPGLAFLGVLGGDRDTARDLDQSLRLALADSGKWTLINRTAKAPQVLAAAGVTAEALRTVEARSAGGARSGIDWKRVQKAVDEEVPGLVYAVAVPSNDLVATHASIWIWPRSPGPAEPDRIQLPLGDPSALADLKGSFNRTIRLQRPWFGALVIDTDGAPHPLVVEVAPASPAEAAGLGLGDLIAGVAGVPVTSRAAFDERIAAAEIGEVLDLAVQSPNGPRNLKIKLGSSPDLLAVDGPNVLDSVAFADLVLLSERVSSDLEWIVELDQALILLRGSEWAEAARRLRSIRAPQSSHGVGQATVDYLLGIALNAAGPDFLEGARQHFEKAAAVPGARLFHNDGAWVAPRARARLTGLGR